VTDFVGGSLLGGVFAQLVGASLAPALAAGGTILAIISRVRRALFGEWINDGVHLLARDLRSTGPPMDFSRQHELLSEGDLDGAPKLFEEESIERSGNPAPLVEAARILRDRGRYKQAIEYFMKALDVPDLDDRRASVFVKQISEIYRRNLSNAEGAIPALEILVGRYPDSSEVEWAWKELTVGMVVSQAADQDHHGAHGAHVPAVKAVERILSEAFVSHASDVHLEDYAGGLRVRYRIDGILQDADPPPARIRTAILARLRVMAGLNPSEHPLPQDARIRVPFAGREVDIPVSTVPTLHGESIALRILDSEAGTSTLEDLGLSVHDLKRLLKVSERPNGMILTTGPGGSGKATTLHALVRHLSTGREKIFTVEDPVEYGIPGVCQVSVNHKAGLTFASLLRSLVRQDPDVLLVGEIRDTETAEIATHAALTGHLVLSTLHTIDAISALHRLVDIGVQDYLVVHTLEAVMAQRLVRRVCRKCAEEHPVSEHDAAALGPTAEGLTKSFAGKGCDRCRDTGFKGRIGVYELLLVSDELRQAFLRRADKAELATIASQNGMMTLREDGIQKIRDGITTPQEVVRATTIM
jgi:general secretion pathway protein E